MWVVPTGGKKHRVVAIDHEQKWVAGVAGAITGNVPDEHTSDKGHIMSLSLPSVTPSSSHMVTTTVDNQHQWQRQSGNNQLKMTADERAAVNAMIKACRNALLEMTVEGRVAVPPAGGDVLSQGDGGSSEMDRLCSMVGELEREALDRTLVYMKQEA